MKVRIPQLRFEHWPASDQRVWDGLFVEGDIFDDAGPACHWAPATRKTNAKHYAQWLGWLDARGLLNDCAEPWRRVRLDRIDAYAKAMMRGRAPRTVASALIGLKCVLVRMAPGEDWRWLKDLTNRLDAWAPSSHNTIMPRQTARELFRIAIFYLDSHSGRSFQKAADRNAYRDTLMIALLIACPIRLRNLAMMEIDRHLRWQNGDWHVLFEPEETKTGQPIHHILPSGLDAPIEVYLKEVRPHYRGACQTSRLWMGAKQAPLAENTIYQNMIRKTRILFGVAINPHYFRSIAATFMSESSPADTLLARPLLGHRSGETTEKYYVRANSIQASRKVADALLNIRDERI